MHQTVFIVLLTTVLLGAVASFLLMGLRQTRRRNVLAGKAHEAGMRFSADDLFDVPRRYRRFALIDAGHSPCANNVTYGRIDRCPVRAFDFRYELGHGTRRTTRHYSVIVFETDTQLPAALMWNEQDFEAAPLAVHHDSARIGRWTAVGSAAMTSLLAEAGEALGQRGVSFQTLAARLMLCAPVRSGQRDYTDWIDQAADLAGKVIPSPSRPRDDGEFARSGR